MKYFELTIVKTVKQSIIYKLDKKDLLIAKYDSKYNFSDIFKDRSDLKETKQNIISSLLLRK
jgi:flagellar biosynthesis/type III secretory pathway chaperone